MRVTEGIFLVLLAALFTMSFAKKEPKTQSQLMTEYIDAELEAKRMKQWQDCYTKTIKDAEQFVDSIIYQQVNFSIGDTLKSPGKPTKPSRPFDTLKLDTTPITPILKNGG